MSSLFAPAGDIWTRFISAAAKACEDGLGRFADKRRIIVTETEPGQFEARLGGAPLGGLAVDASGAMTGDGPACVQAIRGGNVDLVLRPSRFLIRDLPLPAQAGEFLGSIIRNQIDKLTPWPAERAVFGQAVKEATANRLIVALAAADQRALRPVIDAFANLGPRELNVFAGPSQTDGTPRIPLLQRGAGAIRRQTMRRILSAGMIAMFIGSVGAIAYAAWSKSALDDRYDAAQTEIARRRAALRIADPAGDSEARLVARKLTGPAATLAMEELSAILPDNTYVTDLEMTGNKIRVVGLSRDATALIGLIEKSAALSDAFFYAPTTSGGTEPGERFHLEATVRPRGSAKP